MKQRPLHSSGSLIALTTCAFCAERAECSYRSKLNTVHSVHALGSAHRAKPSSADCKEPRNLVSQAQGLTAFCDSALVGTRRGRGPGAGGRGPGAGGNWAFKTRDPTRWLVLSSCRLPIPSKKGLPGNWHCIPDKESGTECMSLKALFMGKAHGQGGHTASNKTMLIFPWH